MGNCDKCNNYDDMASAVALFISECCEMAEKNWCPAHIEMLKRLFGAVLTGVEYADYEEDCYEHCKTTARVN